MTISPYDSLPSGTDDIAQETASTLEYIEVDLDQLAPMPEPVQAPKVSHAETPVQKSAAAQTPPASSHKPAAQRSPVAPKPGLKTTPFEPLPQYSHFNVKNLCGTTEHTLPFEESLLVPDTMPDMQNVLFAEGRADLAQPNKTTYGKDDFLTGDITVYTVYTPAPSGTISPSSGPAAYNASPVDVVKSTIPFKTDKCWEKAEGDSFRVTLAIKNISAEMINERKFVVKGDLLIKITGVGNKELKVFKSADDDLLATSSSVIISTNLVHETSETTDISQDITIREDQPSPVKMLKEAIRISEAHRQITSGKLVINGTIHSQALYLGENDEGRLVPVSLTNKTDFTQFVVMDNDADPDLMKISFDSSDLKLSIENKDKFLLQGNVITHIQVYENKSLETTVDAYHKSREIVFDVDTNLLNAVKDTVSGEISAREVININDNDIKPAQLLCGSCRIATIEGQPEKGRIVIEGSMPVKVLALDDDDNPFVIEHVVPIRGSLETPFAANDIELYIDTAVKDFWFDHINSRQIEINTTLSIKVWLSNEEAFCTIDNLHFAEMETSGKRISMAIYVVGSGDTLWDIAKRYKTDVLTLAELNEIDPEKSLPEGAKLFISK